LGSRLLQNNNEDTPMHESKPAPASLGFLTNVMNEVAREVGAMDADDPRRGSGSVAQSEVKRDAESLLSQIRQKSHFFIDICQ
jgi:hypothetical protein